MNQDNVSPDADIEQRFAAAGLVLAPERRQGAIDSARTLLAATHWVRQPRTAAAEPSNIFVLKEAGR